MNIISASNPIFINDEHTLIHLDVQFEEFKELLPFGASPTDCEDHGRELFERAMAGEFGPIAPYVEPEPVPLTSEQITALRLGAYRAEADPLFFKSQRGETTTEEWLAKIEEIKARYPKN